MPTVPTLSSTRDVRMSAVAASTRNDRSPNDPGGSSSLPAGPDDGERLRDLDVVTAADRRGAAGQANEAEQHAHVVVLPAPLGPREADDTAGLDREAEVIDGGEVAESLREAADLDLRTRREVRWHSSGPPFSGVWRGVIQPGPV